MSETQAKPNEWYRNNPAADFDAHLFEGEDVRAAGVENGGAADHKVPAVCSSTTSYGPFEPVERDAIESGDLPGFDGDLCPACADAVTGDGETE